MPRRNGHHRTPAWLQSLRAVFWLVAALGVSLAGTVPATRAASPIAQTPDAICVDGGQSGRPFAGVNCLETVTTLEAAMDSVGRTGLVVVRAFASADENSIVGMGTYRDNGLSSNVVQATAADPIIVQAEGFTEKGYFVRPIIDGAIRVTGPWELVPGTEATWQTPWEEEPGSFAHEACVDRIWVSRVPGRTQLANFPLTRPLLEQGNAFQGDCGANTYQGQSMTPQQVEAFPGSYEWLDNVLYVHLPNGEDPNQYTVEVPFRHSMSPGRGSSGLVVRGFRVYHTQNGIDLWHCGTVEADHCDATYNETSYNTHFGLQPGKYSLLAHNRGVLNTIQMVKITSDFSDISYNLVGPQLSQGFKLNVVHDCQVHHNEVFGNVLGDTPTGTQAGWVMLGTRDTTAGIYLKNETQRCQVYDNYVHHNAVGIYLRNDGDTLTEDNVIQDNSLVYNGVALGWRDDGMWTYNTAAGNIFGWGALVRWGDNTGPAADFVAATGITAGK
jgi:parallel beta-helix repeat protein